jgi:predicted transcriptional regulator
MGLTIGQAAQAAGVTRKAVRVYEAKGLLAAADRTIAGYRLYTERDVELLTFIRRARTLAPRRHPRSSRHPKRGHSAMRELQRPGRQPHR